MKLTPEKKGQILHIAVEGRLDASWSEFFTETILKHIRNGEHNIVLDARALSYLSSAGIRSLLILHKELHSVNGTLRLVNASEMVWRTLESTGFADWLNDKASDEEAGADKDLYVLDASASLVLDTVSAWSPWNQVDEKLCRQLAFSDDTSGAGIGCAAADYAEAKENFGEFAAFCGRLALQPPNERSKPDYLIAEKQFVPELRCIQSLVFKGPMSHLFRFAPDEDGHAVFTLSELVVKMLDSCSFDAIGFVIAGEIDGLAGASLIKSPGILFGAAGIAFPEIRDWLRFSGERVFAGEQVLVSGVALRTSAGQAAPAMLAQSPSHPGLYLHMHAAVFPYHPLPNGLIKLKDTVARFFQGPSPRAVMHLVDDSRPVNGLGESALLRGACWCGRISNPEVLK